MHSPSFPLLRIVAFAAVILVSGLPTIARAGTTVLDITAFIDGRDQLTIKGNTLQWQHFADSSLNGFGLAAVGRASGQNLPTVISSTVNGVTKMNSFNWTPTWPDAPPNEIRYDAVSSIFTGLTPSLPSNASNFTLTPIENRYSTTITQTPNASNGYALTFQFNDDPPLGGAEYRTLISYTTPDAVPESSTTVSFGLLFILGVGGMLLCGRRKNV